MDITPYSQRLRQNQLKITPKRKAVIRLFLDGRKCLNPFEVRKRLRTKFNQLGLPTIYRILDELESIGILIRVEAANRQLYYGLCHHPEKDHHHFICRKCKRIEEVDFCLFNKIAKTLERRLKCKVESHLFQLEGLCFTCK